MTSFTRVGFVVHEGRAEAVKAAAELARWCLDRGLEVRSLEGIDGLTEPTRPEAFAEGLDLVASVGGDGTLLRAAFMGHRAGAPVLGVMVGRLGFLTEVVPAEAPQALESWLRGELQIEERMALRADAEGAETQWALNEIIVEKRARHRVIRLAATVGEEHVTTFSADGVIVASPTGSTAYSFSAGGPIVSPRLRCMVLQPVAPHMTFDRPVVLAPDERVTLEVRPDEPGLLSADGRPGLELPVGARVEIRRADRPARLLRRPGPESFYSLLRRKFALPAEPPGEDQV
ncbi:MAG TPA: NAD(+)/NADH kinase [Actinomycetota bacterium]|nr:NAD(+)/NADH kinase [Actinomycetota bacterium]